MLFSAIPGNGFTSTGTPRLMLNGKEIATGEDYFPFKAQWLSADEFLYPADGRIKHRSLSGGVKQPVEFSATLTVTPPSYTRRNGAPSTPLMRNRSMGSCIRSSRPTASSSPSPRSAICG